MGSLSWKSVAGLVLTSILLYTFTACGASEDEADDAPFRIGVMESVTGPGETYGNVAVRSKQMAADEINAGGGINGRTWSWSLKIQNAAPRTP